MICKNCGNEISDDAKFCTACGETISPETNENVEQNNPESVGEASESLSSTIDFGENPALKVPDEPKDFSNNTNLENSPEFQDSMAVISNFEEKTKKSKSIVKGLLFGVLGIVVLAVAITSFLHFYNASPSRILAKVQESQSYQKFVTDKGYTLSGYYFVNLMGDDNKELILDLKDDAEGLERKITYICTEENGSYKLGRLENIGGTFIGEVELFKKANSSSPEVCVHLKSIDNVPQKAIDMVKEQMGVENDDEARKFIETNLIGVEEYSYYNGLDYTIQHRSEKSAETDGCDFVFYYEIEKALSKTNDQTTGTPKYQYYNMAEQQELSTDEQQDFSVSEEDFNKYIGEFTNEMEKAEYFTVE